MIREDQIIEFLENDKNYQSHDHRGYIVQVCKLCGCLIDIFYVDDHRIKCNAETK